MKLSKYITLEEFERSQTAQRRGMSNKMSMAQRVAAEQLCIIVLDVIREYYGSALIITSGFRGQALNRLVKGSPKSQHCYGEAADFYVVGVALGTIFEDIKSGKIPIEFDQLIYEGTWIHISYRPLNQRKECLIAQFTNKGVTYIAA